MRLDGEGRRKLAEVAAAYGAGASEAVRTMIDEAYEGLIRDRRLVAAREIGAMTIEDVPEERELARQLDGAHAPTGLR